MLYYITYLSRCFRAYTILPRIVTRAWLLDSFVVNPLSLRRLGMRINPRSSLHESSSHYGFSPHRSCWQTLIFTTGIILWFRLVFTSARDEESTFTFAILKASQLRTRSSIRKHLPSFVVCLASMRNRFISNTLVRSKTNLIQYSETTAADWPYLQGNRVYARQGPRA